MSNLRNRLANINKKADVISNSGAFVNLINEFNLVRKDYVPDEEFVDPTDPGQVKFDRKINKILDKIEILLKELDEAM